MRDGLLGAGIPGGAERPGGTAGIPGGTCGAGEPTDTVDAGRIAGEVRGLSRDPEPRSDSTAMEEAGDPGGITSFNRDTLVSAGVAGL
jgi:hypothetical protein